MYLCFCPGPTNVSGRPIGICFMIDCTMTEKIKEMEGMKAHLPMAHGISKMNHSFFWTFEVLYNPLKNMISISLCKTLCYRIQS